ncbi:hypothetical protein CHS0354_007369 [Potamilus streckersoni]|uniref:Uncharacterized protein n=1 Tax=Potamilus streckersoni TaxID=2493646 RepID=A0AAE0WDA9_9BIVA|nr:hypothetical protein CHS0354_007369 [Potamilus streckersoni]
MSPPCFDRQMTAHLIAFKAMIELEVYEDIPGCSDALMGADLPGVLARDLTLLHISCHDVMASIQKKCFCVHGVGAEDGVVVSVFAVQRHGLLGTIDNFTLILSRPTFLFLPRRPLLVLLNFLSHL